MGVMSESMSPSVGMAVLHLFCKTTPSFDGEALVNLSLIHI